jgi:hypothetical protein
MVTLTYGPDRLYLIAVIGGLGLLVLVVVAGACGVRARQAGARKRRRTTLRNSTAPLLSPEPKSKNRRWTRLPQAGWIPRAGGLAGWVLLAGVGFWLGGYPGAVIVPAAAALFVVAERRAGEGRVWAGLASPWVVACLTVAASLAAAAGQRMLLAGESGLVVTALDDAVPQIVCLLVVARLAAALSSASKIEHVPVV